MKLHPTTRTRSERSAFSMTALASSSVCSGYVSRTSSEPGQGGRLGRPPVAISSASYWNSWPQLVRTTLPLTSISVAQVSK